MREGIAEMWRLVSVEFRRFFARDLTRLFVGLMIVGVVLAALGAWVSADTSLDPERSDRAIEASRREYEANLKRCQTERSFTGPIDFPEDMPEEVRQEIIEEMRHRPPPTRRECVRQVSGSRPDPSDGRFYYGTVFTNVLFGIIPPLIGLAFLLSASFVGAEWGAGTMTSSFTFEPRRLRVLAAKVVAAVTSSAGFTLMLWGLLALALLPAGMSSRGTMAEVDTHLWSEVFDIGWRGLALISVGALIGFGLTNLVRRTIAAIGVAAAWLLVVENFALRFTEQFNEYLIAPNLAIGILGEQPAVLPDRSTEEAILLLALYGIVGFALGAYLFWRRDVASE